MEEAPGSGSPPDSWPGLRLLCKDRQDRAQPSARHWYLGQGFAAASENSGLSGGGTASCQDRLGELVTDANQYSFWGSPGGAVVESLPANAGDMGSNPGPGRSHMPRSNKAREPQLLSLRVWSLCSATRKAAIVRGPCTAMKSGPRSPQLEKALAQKRRPNTAKNK